MKLNIYFRANESAKSAGSVNKDITFIVTLGGKYI